MTNSCHCVVGNDIGRHPLGENHHEVAAGDQAGHQENHHHPQLKLTNHQNRRVKCFELHIQIDIKTERQFSCWWSTSIGDDWLQMPSDLEGGKTIIGQ